MSQIQGKTLTKGKQYYVGVSLFRKEVLLPMFPLITEHHFMENHDMKTMLGMLAPCQPWYRTEMAWAGCYDKSKRFLTEEQAKRSDDYNLYDLAKDEFSRLIKERRDHLELSSKYASIAEKVICIANHTLKEYCLLTDLPQSIIDGYRICPLPLLTALVEPDKYYEGDYDTDDKSQQFIGRWAGHSISSEYVVPEGYTEIKPEFWEDPKFEVKNPYTPTKQNKTA